MIIVQDTREQTPWDFSFFGADQKIKTLKTGDYSIEGFENQFCIERKKSTGELAINLGSKAKQFQAELERMKTFTHKYLVFEFSIATLLSFPLLSGIPKHQMKGVRMNANYMVSQLEKFEDKYGIEVYYTENATEANEVAYTLMKRFYESSAN